MAYGQVAQIYFDAWWKEFITRDAAQHGVWAKLRDPNTAAGQLQSELNLAFIAGWQRAEQLREELAAFDAWFEEQNHCMLQPEHFSPRIALDVIKQIAYLGWKAGRESKGGT